MEYSTRHIASLRRFAHALLATCDAAERASGSERKEAAGPPSPRSCDTCGVEFQPKAAWMKTCPECYRSRPGSRAKRSEPAAAPDESADDLIPF